MAIDISWAQAGDAKELERLDKMAQEENRTWKVQTTSQFKKIINKSKYFVLVARRGDEAIGYLQADLKNTNTHAWVENVYVRREFRKGGLAKAIMLKFTNHWKGKVDYIVLLTSDEHVGVFKKLGFEKEMNYMGYRHARGKKSHK